MKSIATCMRNGKKAIKYLALGYIYYHIMLPFSNEYIDITKECAYDLLMDFSEKPKGKSITRNTIVSPAKYDLQIIVPAYNEEDNLKKCIDSIISQKTRFSYQVVIIDDGSTDNTGTIADSYKDSRIKVIHQKNKGFSGARNTGLNTVEARYLAFVDSDDWLPEGAIESLMNVATQQNAEIVQGGYYYQIEQKVHEWRTYPHTKRLMDVFDLYGQPWGKVFRSDLWQDFCFPEGFWFEDTVISFMISLHTNNVWLISDNVYVYRENKKGITKTSVKKNKSIDTYWVTESIMEEYGVLGLPNNELLLRRFLKQVVINAKRVRAMPDDIRKAIFVMTCELHNRYFAGKKAELKYATLQKALINRNYGIYELFTWAKG